ncbi:9916_t:CDS:2, partial [Racocetra persica]
IFEDTHTENIQLQTDLSSLQFQFLTSENNNLLLSETPEINENLETDSLENEVWTEAELLKFKILYQKTIDSFEKQENDNQKLEEEINLIQDNDFKELFEKDCCEKNCLQTKSKNNSKKSKLTTEYNFEEKAICLNAFKTIYGIGDTRWKALREHFIEHDITLRINSKTGKVGNRAISFETVIKIITFINNYAKQNGLPSP